MPGPWTATPSSGRSAGGGFGEVYYATSDSGKEVALKLILKNLDVERRGVVQCMNLKCPNLLAIHDLKSNESGETFVVMEYVAGPSLANVLTRHPGGMPVAEVRAWLKGLVEGVAYLHDHGIVHRDLKPANLFMEEGIVKIGDYGLAKLITPSQGTEHSESIVTCHYMAPEIASGKYHKPIDVYAIGVVLYEMLTGHVPFQGETVGEILMKHLTARPDLSVLPEPFRSIVGRALAKDPNQRPSRVHDLLPPEDAPKPAAVRFIGDGKTAPPLPPAPEPRREEEDILRIGAEEPVFYIGPETRPPLRRPSVRERLQANWAARQRQRARPNPSPAPAHAPRPAPAPARQTPVRLVAVRRTNPAPVVPAEPPPLPSGRVRVAELAGSMLLAAPVVGLLAAPACGLLEIDPSSQPQLFAYLAVLALLGTWGVLIAGKVCEGKTVEASTGRLMALAIGVALGAGSLVIDETLRVRALAGHAPGVLIRTGPWFSDFVADGHRVPVETVLYFGAFFLATNWAKLTTRDRKARFRVWPILLAGLIGAALTPLTPNAEPYGLAVGVLVAVASQLVSPWNEAAALHAKYRARKGRWAA